MPPVSKSSPSGGSSPTLLGPWTHTPLESCWPEASKQGRQPIPWLQEFRRTENRSFWAVLGWGKSRGPLLGLASAPLGGATAAHLASGPVRHTCEHCSQAHPTCMAGSSGQPGTLSSQTWQKFPRAHLESTSLRRFSAQQTICQGVQAGRPPGGMSRGQDMSQMLEMDLDSS